MKLEIVPATHIDKAWRDGACKLSEVCALVEEITGSQLKMILSRGERYLVAMKDGEETVGWATFNVELMPNMRVFFIKDLYAPHSQFERFWEEVKKMADAFGCLKVRCAAQAAQARLYQMKLGMKPVYTTLEIEV